MLKLLIIDDDLIFRTGLRTICDREPDLQVVAETGKNREAFQLLAGAFANVDLVILDLAIQGQTSDSYPDSTAGLVFCQQLKTSFSQVPVLLLTSLSDSSVILAAQRLGIEGYCPKGTVTPELINAIRLVGQGQNYWPLMPTSSRALGSAETKPGRQFNWKYRTFLSGSRQIERSLAELSTQLDNPFLSPLDRAFLQGRQRELRLAQWLLKQWFANDKQDAPAFVPPPFQPPEPRNFQERPKADLRTTNSETDIVLQPEIFESTFYKLNSSLFNFTDIPLEIDILQTHKKRELLSITLRQIEVLIKELRLADVSLPQIEQKRNALLQDLWQLVLKEFFGKYYTVLLGNSVLEVVPVLLADAGVVQTEIFDKIPYVENVFAYFLFKSSLKIDNQIYAGESAEARFRAEFLLQNLAIQISNAVIQPLLNHFSESEEIKHEFFDRRWLSNRSILKFRNNLSWKYRVERYITEPTAIFESRYWLFILDERGIRKLAIYAPRTEELGQLSGIPLVVTYVLESRDAIAPRLRSAVSFLGSGVVYLLTQVIGRGLGLVARGIIQGIGSSWPEGKLGKNTSRRD
ncbi:DUF3685 domain-containing protein [Ancylothrix sp. C2]|uniref:DUF3685 domain-containing protein n=1 Tax=Ancylothrix sp. D3o TaxID=2953691 RepID=UPI0021BB8E30|nr:DUF3685 domain-containing protein [Ancylothrix sp. D3o]MCT7952334.1 DUF3685 domain-containing protein [Ancylothrix sp. D3o]